MEFWKKFQSIRNNQVRRKSLYPQLVEMRGGNEDSPKNFSSVRAQEGTDSQLKVYIYDVIGWPWITAQDLVDSIPETAKEIDLFINSPGGDALEGMAIYNFFDQHQATVRVHITGLAASAASLVASVGSIEMAKASFLMIHNAWVIMAGDAEELRKEAEFLDKIGDIYAEAYVAKTGKKKAEILQWMKDATYFTPDEAKEAGFADSIAESGGKVQNHIEFDTTVFQRLNQTYARAAGSPPPSQNHNSEEDAMNEKLRKMLVKKGMDPNSTDEQAWAFLDSLEKSEKLSNAEKTKLEKLKQEPITYTNEDLEEAARIAAQAAAKAERERANAIMAHCRTAGLEDDFANTLVNEDLTIAQASERIFAKLKEVNPSLGSGRISTGEHDQDKYRQAVIDGLCWKIGIRPAEPAPGHEQFRAASIESVARLCLDRMGVSTVGLYSRDQIAREILKRSAAFTGFSTDDFTSIFLDVANKAMLKAYQEAPNTWRPWVNVVSASDFKTIYGISLSEAPDLELVNEHGEYKSGAMSDSQESYSVATYGKIIYLSRPMIVNDDLRAFTRLPQLMGTAARRKEGDLVWAKITSNPTMNDSKALFHVDHNNLEATNKGLVTSDNLDSGRVKMRTQTGPKGATLDLQPAFVLLPVAQETSTEILLRSAASTEDSKNAGVYNPWNGRLQPIAEPRLDAVSVKAWYLVANPAQVDTVEVAYLDGNEAPYTEEQTEFVRDAVGYKIRHDFGCGVMEHRGFYRNPGE